MTLYALFVGSKLNFYELDENLEHAAQKATRRYLKAIHQVNLEANLNNLFDIDGGYVSRFEYFFPFLLDLDKQRLLISGCAVGSEIIVAKRYGFQEVYGTEVSEEYVKVARERLKNDPTIHIDFYDGKYLPYQDSFFSMIYSGHVIEHTSSPFLYLKEHLRVLKNGGIFFLEFPDRYHNVELHTGLKSYEWLPHGLRNLVLSFLARKEKMYRDVLEGLKPVSIWQIKLYWLLAHEKYAIIDIQKPAPGYVRMIIQK